MTEALDSPGHREPVDQTGISESGPRPAGEGPAGAVRGCAVRAEIAPRITFATHQCDVAVIADLVIVNDGEEDLDDLSLQLSTDPPVLAERVWTIDRVAARSEFRPSDRRVTIAGGKLDQLTERERAEVRLTLKKGDATLAEARYPTVALARNEWGGARYMPELLAAFVMPNDPAVARLLKDASKILQGAGRSGALDGYQSRSRTRSYEIVSGIWAAVTSRGLTYAEPPASFGTEGQKIRFPSMIEEQGLATCLDTALLFAAAIEQAGLHPVVVFTEGHALAGAWLQPQSLPALTVDDPMEIRKAIDLKELVLFETTLATAGHALPLAKAASEGRRQVDEANEASFIYAIDIRQARGRGIQPLSSSPAPGGHDAAGADAVRPAPALDIPPDLPPFDADPEPEGDPEQQTPAERLDRWKRSLLDLSKRNRLLNLRPSATAIPIFCPDPAKLEDKIAEGKRISIITPPERRTPEGDIDPGLYRLRTGDDLDRRFAEEALERNEVVANVDAKSLEKGAIELYRKAKADFEEGGSNTLFLALGMLRWSPQGDRQQGSYRAPMIMLPVRLERASAASRPKLARHEDEPVFNLTLLQMLRQDFDIDLGELAAELETDAHGVDVRRIWEKVRMRVRDVPGFEVVEEVVLSTFSFAKFLMWKDLQERTQELKKAPFVRHLIDTPREPYRSGASFLAPRDIDRAIDPATIMAPLNADASQIVAIHASGGDGDFVLEGPPGTGKSETIGNIIAHNLGLGRRVLFVSEKMAALEVVYSRLQKCGLGDFCLELHSAKANKAAVLKQLGDAWTHREAHSPVEWKRIAARLAEVRGDLNGLVEALHAPGPAGVTPREAIGRVLRYGDVHRLVLDWDRDPLGLGHAPTPEALEALEDIARRLGQWFGQLQPEDLAVFEGIEHTDWSNLWAEEIAAAARSLAAAIDALVRSRQDFAERLAIADAGSDPEESAAIAALAALVPDCARLNLRFALEADGKETIAALHELAKTLHIYRGIRKDLAPEYPDARFAEAQVEEWIAHREAAAQKIWPFRAMALKKLRKAIRTGLGLPHTIAAPERDLETLRDLAALQGELDRFASGLPAGSPWKGLDTDEAGLSLAIASGERLRDAVNRLASCGRDLIETRQLLARALCDGRDLLEPGMPIAAAARDLAASHAEFRACHERFRVLSGFREGEGATEADLAALTRATTGIIERHARLNHWCRWVEISRDARAQGLGTLVQALLDGRVAPDRTVEAFRTAYARWLAPILMDARPALRRFSSVEHEDLIATFRNLDRELAETAAAHIRAKLSAGIPARDAGGVDPGYGILSRELQKRARHMPVRQLVTSMGSALTTLTPCLLMSPLSVAQFLPADCEPFDLVIFDEASQITVPDAIGAIARGKRCIVVGDPKQMPPTRFFERGAEDDENEEARDLESILDEALAARVPHHRLTGHYRSRHESLICFSNHAYYGGELVTYPSADTAETAVSLRRVEGVYAKGKARTNPIEARAVVAEVVRRLNDPDLDHLSLGVVTLNSEQQRLIEDLLDAERRANPELEPFFGENAAEPVFVKNLETVQGDQRDVILLSVGYGPTEPGARTMSMNFGPLNRQGGERRLNVAITRATTEVVVFASFDADMIDLTRTSAAAVRDLKHYIDFAARGPVAIGSAIQAAGGMHGYDSDFEMAVAEGLRRLGWDVRTQIGVSKFRIDLGIVHPDARGRFLAGVECDGATYHSSPSARDRDRVRQIILEQLGWRLVRLWSTEYFRDPEAALAGVDARLRALLESDRAAAALQAPAADESRDAEGIATAIPEDAMEESGCETAGKPGEADDGWSHSPDPSQPVRYARSAQSADVAPASSRQDNTAVDASGTPAEGLIDPAQFYEPGYQSVLQRIALEMIDAEGPITFKQLSDRIARLHGFQRTGRTISGTIEAAVGRQRPRTRTPDDHTIFWPEGGTPRDILEFRGMVLAGELREWRDIPHPEKLGLVRAIRAADPADLPRAVADRIGLGRVSAQFRDEIDDLVERLDRQY